MGKSLLNSITIDTDQQKGSTLKNTRLEDHWRSEVINTASGVKLYLAVVADGGGKSEPDRAAKLAVDTIFDESKRSRDDNPTEIFRKSLSAANQAVYQLSNGADYVGLTIIAVTDDRIYIGQAGKLTRAYLAKNNTKFEQLQGDTQSDRCLGDKPDNPEINVKSINTVKLGERIILCSDGLFNPPEDPNNASASEEVAKKVEKEIPIIGQYDDIRGSARHMSSIAKGMDVSDDITVVILGFGRKQKRLPIAVLATIGIFVILAIIGISVLTLIPKVQSASTDLGVVYMIKGNVSTLDQNNNTKIPVVGQFINYGTTIEVGSDSPANLQLETRANLQDTNPHPILGANIYLAETAQANFTSINLSPFNAENQPTDPALLNQTRITLIKGQLLIVSDGSRNFVVLAPLQNGKGNVEILLNSGGKGVLGAKVSDSSLEVDCIQGNCQFILSKDQHQPLASHGKSVFDLSNAIVSSQDQAVQDSDIKGWTDICMNAQLSNASEACKLSQ